ncbi:hypothetical protein [Parvibaculum sp.]|uniref:hypothetical protein n=1 Tax=Parvibaculum sp. TaxID=2024848 RepID=UPI002C643390|nr:hypothetical protein [Parvibaculum sp.]HUD51145.1 hypothetical protein [Parvibaculum sp.]
MSSVDDDNFAFEHFSYKVDLPMSRERARSVSIGPVAEWCRRKFGPLGEGWTYETRGDTIRFCFSSEDAAELFAGAWSTPR